MPAAMIETLLFISSFSLFENVEYFFRKVAFSRLLPTCFEVFFPVLRPGPAVVIDEAGIRVRELRRSAVCVVDIAQTFDVRVSPVLILNSRSTCKAIRCPHWRDKGVWVVEDGLMIETDELSAGIHCRLPDFHGFHFVAVFKHRMRQRPTLNICGVCDQSGPIPEPDRFSKPLRDSLNMLFLADHDLAQKVIRDAGNRLHHPRRHGELKITRLRGLRPPAHETFRVAKGGTPLRRIRYRLVID